LKSVLQLHFYSILRLELERIDGNIRQLEKEAEAAGSSPLGRKIY
jgi:hypothetical protein